MSVARAHAGTSRKTARSRAKQTWASTVSRIFPLPSDRGSIKNFFARACRVRDEARIAKRAQVSTKRDRFRDYRESLFDKIPSHHEAREERSAKPQPKIRNISRKDAKAAKKMFIRT